MTNNLKNPIIITVSDVHLGGGNSHPDLFRQFLEEIIIICNNRKKKPRVLLILGDIFDILMNTYENLTKEYLSVFKQLNDIYNNGIRIIITLGNHEVSVTGDYDKEFTSRKLVLIERFQGLLRERGLKADFLTKKNICQYALLNNINNEWELWLYDSKYQIPNKMPNNIKPIKLGKCDLESKYMCMFTHGYQFFKSGTKWAGEFVWDPLFNAKPSTKEKLNKFYNISGFRTIIKKSSSIGKDVLDKVWNQWKQEMRSEVKDETIRLLAEQFNKEVNGKENIIDTSEIEEKKKNEDPETFQVKAKSFFKDLGKSIKNIASTGLEKAKEYMSQEFFNSVLNNMAQTDELIEELKKLKDVDEKIVEYLREEMFKEVTHVVYGHTHHKIHSKLKDTTLVNDGAWQHAEPSYVMIGSDGEIEIFDYPDEKLT